MNNQEIENYLQGLLLSDQIPPSTRDIAKKFKIYNWKLVRDHRELSSLLIKKRKAQLKRIYDERNKSLSIIFQQGTCLRCSKNFQAKSKFNKLCPDCNLQIKNMGGV